MSEDFLCNFIKDFFKDKDSTFDDLSNVLQNMYPGERGFGVGTMKRFCAKHGIRRRTVVEDEGLDNAVRQALSEVGPVFGRKMMKGYLESKFGAPVASEGRIGRSLSKVTPIYQRRRQTRTERQTNPQPYVAEYHGHKLHIDQNEKLAMYGVTHVCCIDGYSRYIPAFTIMSVKNNVLIYDNLFRKVVLEEGLFDQIRVDQGKEFYLTLYAQECLAHLTTNAARDPHRQTQSKKNLRIERFWVEVNARVNYPIKNALRRMEEMNLIDMELSDIKFCVSEVSLKFARLGMEKVVQSWNHHRIPGAGKPITLRNTKYRVARIQPHEVLSAQEIVNSYESHGGEITRFPTFGEDPLSADINKMNEREQRFNNSTNVDVAYNHLVNEQDSPFCTAVISYITITRSLV